MKAEFLNPFVKSVVQIVESTVGEPPARGKVYLRGAYPYNSGDVLVMIGITGALRGQVVLTMNDDCARNIAAVMLMEEKVLELDEYAQSALGEMVNMIAANATIGLSEAGYICNITPPTIITGQHMEITCQEHIQTIVIPMDLNAGHLDLNLSVVEAGIEPKPRNS